MAGRNNPFTMLAQAREDRFTKRCALRQLPLVLAFCASALPAFAADLDIRDPLEPAPLVARPVVPPQTVLGPNLVPVPGLRVGGAFVYAPGLNGPDGAPAYPLLPFAFGYGY